MAERKEAQKAEVKFRFAFPDACKWFQRDDAEAKLEVESRSHRFIKTGLSPCDDCPLCPQVPHPT